MYCPPLWHEEAGLGRELGNPEHYERIRDRSCVWERTGFGRRRFHRRPRIGGLQALEETLGNSELEDRNAFGPSSSP